MFPDEPCLTGNDRLHVNSIGVNHILVLSEKKTTAFSCANAKLVIETLFFELDFFNFRRRCDFRYIRKSLHLVFKEL